MNARDAADQIARALRDRTGIDYSVTAGRGTMRSWIVIDIARERRGLPTARAEREALARHLGYARWEGTILVRGTEAARREHLDRALGPDRSESDDSLASLLMPLADDPGRGF